MKTKLRILSVVFGILAIVALSVLLYLGIIADLYLWVMYAYGVALLFILVPLSHRVKREDDVYDALVNVKQAKKALHRIQTGKKVGVFKLQAARNQLAETSISFREIVCEKELYPLEPLLKDLDVALTHYKDDENFQAVVSASTLQADLELLDAIEKALKDMRSAR